MRNLPILPLVLQIRSWPMGESLHVVYCHSWNTFRGQTNLELQVLDFACGACPLDWVG